MPQTSDAQGVGHFELVPFTAALLRAANRNEAFDCLASALGDIGFGPVCLTIEDGGVAGGMEGRRWTSLDATRRAQLKVIGFGWHDPVRRFARRASEPFTWTIETWPGDRSAAARTIMLGLNKVEIEAGLTVTVWGRGGRMAIVDAFGSRQHVGDLSTLAADIAFIAAAQTFRAIERMTDERDEGPRLTAREIQILELSAQGLSAKSIACRLSIVEPTVKFHFKSIRDKLKARNKAEAVARFTALGRSALLSIDQC